MPSRGLRGSAIVTMVLGSLAVAGGCGGSDSATHVQLDKEKNDAVLKSMGDYMKKPQSKPFKGANP